MASVNVINCCLDSIREVSSVEPSLSEELKGAKVYLDAGCTESFKFLGAFPVLLEIGVLAVCSLESMSSLDMTWIQGFRKVTGVDGAFLKGVCTGELTAAVGRDANNQMFPIAWAVVSIENRDSWTWFLDLLIEDIGCPQGSGITILSDGHKGLREVVRDICPNAEHRVYDRHIYANFSKRFKGPHFKYMFWDAAKASTPVAFEIAMGKIKRVNPLAHSYLMDWEPKC